MAASWFLGLGQPSGPLGGDAASNVPLESGADFAWLVVGMMVMLGLAAFVHRRVGMGRGTGECELKMVATLPLGDKRAIVMVEAEHERLLVGITSQHVQLISRLPSGESAGELGVERLEPAAPSPAQRRGFGALLRGALARGSR